LILTIELQFIVEGVETAIDLTLNDINTLVDIKFENFILTP